MNQYILEARGLVKQFGGHLAVGGVNLRIERGHIHALIGPNGAGKTTVFNLLTKFLQPTAGTINYRDNDITRARPAEVARMGMARSFQISAIFPHLTVLDNFPLALQRSLDVLNERAEELIAAVGLADYTHAVAADLSYGRRRALEIATTLSLEPE